MQGLLRLEDIESMAEGIDLKEVEVSQDMFALAMILTWAGKNGLTNLHKCSEMLMSRDFQSFHSYQTVSAMWKLKWKRPIPNQDPGARDMITFYFWAKTVEKG